MHTMYYASSLLLALAAVAALPAAAKEKPPEPQRVQEIAALLPEQPTGLGRPISDRAAWAKLAKDPAFHDVLKRAENLLKEPLPAQPDDLFLQFTRNGNRTNWQRVSGQRRGRLPSLVIAECIENKSRFIPAITQLVDALCAERTWVMPAHDGSLANFNGKTVDIDLGSSALGWGLATADYLLGDKLSPATRTELRDNIRRRILDPFRAMVTGARDPNWWILGTNNWNAVCLAGVIGTALAEADTPADRALFVAATEKYSQNFLAGFTSDGYCSEGLGYWNYGFGHYMLLSETIRQATGGRLDLMARPEARMPANFGARIQIINGVSPAFADCGVGSTPMASLMYYTNNRFGLGLRGYEKLKTRDTLGDLPSAMLFAFALPIPQSPATAEAAKHANLRTWFDKAGILISRPAPGSACLMGVALKGGNNAENHNHNDVGSYTVVLGDRQVLLDPGGETYTARTFSSHRYDSKLLNSFGHAVPMVAGQLQREGKDAQGKLLRADFTDQQDTLQFDIASAYTVPELKTLTRTFVYSRVGAGSLTVTDQVAFKSPQAFGTALITRGSWQRKDDGSLVIYDMDQAVQVTISAEGGEFALKAEEIHEDASVQPTRLGINFTQPVTTGSITVKITPLAQANNGTGLLRNGGFEYGAFCWDIPKDDKSEVSEEKAATGKASLKITDRDAQGGTNVNSARIPMTGGKALVLRGKVRHESGQGIGIYVKYYDANGMQINPDDGQGNISAVGTPTGAVGQWADFAFPFKTPADTATICVWIHSFNSAKVDAFLDDLEIVPQGK